MRNLIILASIIFLITSCEKEIELDNKYAKHKLVVNALLHVDSTVNIAIFKSNLPLEKESSFLSIKDAEVELLENGTKHTFSYDGIDTIYQGDNANFYTSNHIVKENTTYDLKVKTKEFGETTASIKVPSKPIIEKFKFIKKKKYNAISFDLIDNQDEENYYFFSIYYTFKDTFMNEYSYNQFLFSDNSKEIFENYGENRLISDKLFNGLKYHLVLNINYDKESDNLLGEQSEFGDDPLAGLKILNAVFKVSTVNKAYYNYVISINKQLTSQGDPFSEVASITNNIENGVGIFGVVNTKTFKIVL